MDLNHTTLGENIFQNVSTRQGCPYLVDGEKAPSLAKIPLVDSLSQKFIATTD